MANEDNGMVVCIVEVSISMKLCDKSGCFP